jgi:hypothetical protein
MRFLDMFVCDRSKTAWCEALESIANTKMEIDLVIVDVWQGAT